MADRILGPILPEAFYYQSTEELARQLLNAILVHQTATGCRAGRIIECEMYQGPLDKAAHSYGGRRTPRTEVMYGRPGRAYVYLIYGMHYCFNVVTGDVGTPHAVLIRAMEPLIGLDDMLASPAREKTLSPNYRVLAGPGRLTRALAIDKNVNGHALFEAPLYLTAPSVPWAPYEVAVGRRINIGYAQEAQHFLWRFWVKDHPALSTAPRSYVATEPSTPLGGLDDTI